jgi:site-specific DNA-adenine methylase
LERLVTASNLSYEQVKINNPNSILYCDIPYDTAQKKGNYLGTFDHEEFYDWARNNQNTVVFSEYIENVPADFEIIWKKPKRNLAAGGTGKISIEVLAWNKK